jgi:hypothetical protein
MMDERDMELELRHQELEEANDRLRRTFEELKQIRSKLLYGDEPAYVVEDMVQELISRVGHYIGEF